MKRWSWQIQYQSEYSNLWYKQSYKTGVNALKKCFEYGKYSNVKLYKNDNLIWKKFRPDDYHQDRIV